MSADETRALIAGLRKDAGEYAIHVRGDNAGHDLSWDQRNVRAWQAADALEALLPVPDGDARERLIHLLFDQVPEDWDENDIGILVDAILAAFPVLSRAAASEPAIERVRALHRPLDTQAHYALSPDWKPVQIRVCSHCKRPGAGDALHPWPCPTIQALGPLPVGGESE